LHIYADGNLSFTRIVNHTRQALRRGKNSGGTKQRKKTSPQSRLPRLPHVVGW
jgi:hypothetical protein